MFDSVMCVMLMGVAVALFVSAAFVYLGWNNFLVKVTSTESGATWKAPELQYWDCMAGVVFVSAVGQLIRGARW